MKKVHTNKGFTLAELLIVVAIIAILVAVAIPTLGNQAESSRQSVDVSNLRGAYTAAKLVELTGKLPNGDTATTMTYWYNPKTGGLELDGSTFEKGKATASKVFADTSNLDTSIISYADTTVPTAEKNIKVKFVDDDPANPTPSGLKVKSITFGTYAEIKYAEVSGITSADTFAEKQEAAPGKQLFTKGDQYTAVAADAEFDSGATYYEADATNAGQYNTATVDAGTFASKVESGIYTKSDKYTPATKYKSGTTYYQVDES